MSYLKRKVIYIWENISDCMDDYSFDRMLEEVTGKSIEELRKTSMTNARQNADNPIRVVRSTDLKSNAPDYLTKRVIGPEEADRQIMQGV